MNTSAFDINKPDDDICMNAYSVHPNINSHLQAVDICTVNARYIRIYLACPNFPTEPNPHGYL